MGQAIAITICMLITTSLAEAKAVAACENRASYAQDQAIFKKRLRMLKDRVAGYDEFQKQKAELEVERIKGVASIRKQREKEEAHRQKVARAYRAIRQREERLQHQEMSKGWKIYAAQKRAERKQLRCAREAYVRARNQFNQAEEHIRQMTEERELSMVSR